MAPKAKGKAAAEKAKSRAAPKAKAPQPKASPKRASSEPPKKRASSENLAGPPAKAAKRSGGGGARPVDGMVPGRDGYRVHEDYSVKMNQTNIGGNNNKFYVVQVLEKSGSFFAWNRWGRVGEDGQNKLEPCGSVEAAIKSYEKKHKEKLGRGYADVEMEETEDAGGGESAPLGKLSKGQIEKGMGVLQQIEAKIKAKAPKVQLEQLSSQFFTMIPTNFGRKVPEPILTEEQKSEKEELLKFWLRMGFEDTEEDSGLKPIDGIMALKLPSTLQEAAGSVCSAGDIKSSTAQGDKLAAKQAGKPGSKMDGSLYAAIMLYTSNAIYAALNKALRDMNRSACMKYFSYLRLLFEAMNTLPKKNSTLWRGIPVDLYDQYTVGSTQTWWNVSSCTADINVAKNFMKGCGGKCTLLTIEAQTACDISEITFFANEKESLLAPGTQLQVASSKRAGNLTEITLKEVGRVVS